MKFYEKEKIHNRSKQTQTWGKKEDYLLKMKTALTKKLAKRTLKKEWFEKNSQLLLLSQNNLQLGIF